jgi:hypothetical protein
MVGHGDPSQVPRDRVVRADRRAAALQGVLAQRAGRLSLVQLGQGTGEGGRRLQGGRVVRAERPAAALQGVLAQGAGLLGVAQLEQSEG